MPTAAESSVRANLDQRLRMFVNETTSAVSQDAGTQSLDAVFALAGNLSGRFANANPQSSTAFRSFCEAMRRLVKPPQPKPGAGAALVRASLQRGLDAPSAGPDIVPTVPNASQMLASAFRDYMSAVHSSIMATYDQGSQGQAKNSSPTCEQLLLRYVAIFEDFITHNKSTTAFSSGGGGAFVNGERINQKLEIRLSSMVTNAAGATQALAAALVVVRDGAQPRAPSTELPGDPGSVSPIFHAHDVVMDRGIAREFLDHLNIILPIIRCIETKTRISKTKHLVGMHREYLYPNIPAESPCISTPIYDMSRTMETTQQVQSGAANLPQAVNLILDVWKEHSLDKYMAVLEGCPATHAVSLLPAKLSDVTASILVQSCQNVQD
jgi:hypothetical protein